MRYMMRLVYHCKRGKAPEIVECLKFINQVYASQDYTNGKICVDRIGRMDTVVYEFEVESLDQFFTWLNGVYANPNPETVRVVERLNENAEEGYREIYEIIG